METWRLLVALTGILLLYAILVPFTDMGTSPADILTAIVFGLAGLFLGRVITNRFFESDDEK